MRQLIAAMQQQMDQGGTFSRSGVISGYDPSSYAVKVDIMPEGYTTGWIQLDAQGVGNGWGVAIGPQLGDEVTVTFENGDPKLGRVTSRHFNDVNVPISPPSGEVWILHKTGSLLKFHNDGTVEVLAESTLKYTATQHHFIGPVQMDNTLQVTQQITGQGGMSISGGSGAAMQVTGDMHSTGTITGDTDVIAAGKSGKGHTHHENGAGGNTNPPN
ncbi:phage baseplate assembly protein V [Aquitalea aquatilis]|uniref:phage baseplate assembly protein V n=1 Tax=Aquitalea aquatilis TaxID=1537400 RepID=UPI00196B38F4|nr:phage baseplate assembly protein V [Aquitalea aquatilis]